MAKALYICLNPECGGLMEGTDKEVKKFCPHCKTADKRKAAHEENEIINKQFKLKLQTNG